LLDADPLYELFPVIGRVTEQQLGGLGTLEVKVCVVLPGEADPAVDLYGFARGVEASEQYALARLATTGTSS